MPVLVPNLAELRGQLEHGILAWWREQQMDFLDEPTEDDPENTLSDGMPAIDSKVAATSTTVFQNVLGMKLNTKLIKPKGYGSIQAMIEDLVPKMLEEYVAAQALATA